MKFYTQTHKHYCGIDLHARNLYVCILDQAGFDYLAKVVTGIKFKDGIEVTAVDQAAA